MRRSLIAAAAMVAAAGLAPMAAQAGYSTADKCGPKGPLAPTAQGVKTIIIPTTGPVGTRTFYVDDRTFPEGNGLWLYEETNKVANLQRVTGTAADTSVDKVPNGLGENKDTCTDMAGAPAGTKADHLYN